MYKLDMELPGYKKEDISVELKDGVLMVKAETKNEVEEKDEKGNYIRRERHYGSCNRSFYVGDAITEEDIMARYEDGVLKIEIPEKEEPEKVEEKKHIEIN